MKGQLVYDLALASFLAATGHKILSVKSDEKKSAFTFQQTEQLEKDILSFFNREGRVDPLGYSEMLRNLKALAMQRR
jgi:hypothetical protein